MIPVMLLPLVILHRKIPNVGYDLRTKEVYEETWRIFDNIVGFKYLAGLHLNDSRSTLGSQRDLHANLGYTPQKRRLTVDVVSSVLNHSD